MLGEQPVKSDPTPAVPPPKPAPASVLSSKFVSSGTTLSSTVATPGLQSASAFAKVLSSQQSKVEEPQKPKKVFTKATREETDWQPVKLLCKRFDVEMPVTTDTGTKSNRDASQSLPLGLAVAFAPTQASMTLKQPTGPPPAEDKLPSELTGPSEAPAIDLFKAIFETPVAPVPEPSPQTSNASGNRGFIARTIATKPVGDRPDSPDEDDSQPMMFPLPPPGFVSQSESSTKQATRSTKDEKDEEEDSLPMMFPQPPPGFSIGGDSSSNKSSSSHHHHHSSKNRSKSPEHSHHHHHHHHHSHKH